MQKFSNVAYKVLSNIILSRITPVTEEIIDQMCTIRQLLEKSCKLIIDYQQAYDSVKIVKIWETMAEVTSQNYKTNQSLCRRVQIQNKSWERYVGRFQGEYESEARWRAFPYSFQYCLGEGRKGLKSQNKALPNKWFTTHTCLCRRYWLGGN